MTPTNEKCPKCGETRRYNYKSFFLFGCDTKVYRDGSGMVSQSAFCELIERNFLLQKQNADLREALKPFARWGAYCDYQKKSDGELLFATSWTDGGKMPVAVSVEDLRRASAVLSQNPEPQSEGKI